VGQSWYAWLWGNSGEGTNFIELRWSVSYIVRKRVNFLVGLELLSPGRLLPAVYISDGASDTLVSFTLCFSLYLRKFLDQTT